METPEDERKMPATPLEDQKMAAVETNEDFEDEIQSNEFDGILDDEPEEEEDDDELQQKPEASFNSLKAYEDMEDLSNEEEKVEEGADVFDPDGTPAVPSDDGMEDEPATKKPGAVSVSGEQASMAAMKEAQKAAEAGQTTDKAAPKKKATPKKQINPNFKDVRETGQWGAISKTEKIVGMAVLAAIVIAVVVVVVIFVGKDDDDELININVTSAPTMSLAPSASPTSTPPLPPTIPTPSPTGLPVAIELEYMLAFIANNTVVSNTLTSFSDNPADYIGLYMDETAAPSQRAVSWLLEVNTSDDPQGNLVLYALANIYYSLGGNNWTDATNWMTDTPVCGWFGIICNRLNTIVEELDLPSNNLAGELPNEITFLGPILVISLQNNGLTGSLPGTAIRSLEQLIYLYLQNNMLSGRVPGAIGGAPSLNTLMLYGNDFSGVFPNGVCGVETLGLDCGDFLSCNCCPANNCYD